MCSPCTVYCRDVVNGLTWRARPGTQPQGRPADFVVRSDVRAGRTEKVAGEHSLPDVIMQTSIFMSLKSGFLQLVRTHAIRNMAGRTVQSRDPRQSTVDNSNQFGAEFWRAVLQQALLGLFRRIPCGVAIRFLRRFEPGHFAKVGSDGEVGLGSSSSRRPCAFFRSGGVKPATEIAGEGECLHPAVNASLFKRLERGGLRGCKAGFHATFGENPTPAAGLNQQKFDAAFADAVTNRGDLSASSRKPR